jgi:hypothetical protein
MSIDWEKLESRAARWANIVSTLPGFYCAYGLWEQRHPGSSPAVRVPGFTFALIFFVVCIAVGAVLNFARRSTHKRKDEQSQPDSSPPLPQAEHKLSSLIPDGRLKIISAHYGVDGGPNADVAEEYLRPKVCGHSLAGWVGADLFGGFQPVIGLVKRVKVHYSFDGTEGTISKKEHELLVLPDPSLVEAPRIVITGLKDDDPLIVPSFVDGRKHPLADFVSFELKNSGKRDALWVRIHPVKLQKRIVFFDTIAECIAPTDFRRFYADVENQSGIDGNRDLVRAMNEEWASRFDHATFREIPFPARIDFEDSEGTRFECNFALIYHGGRGYNQPVDFKCIECRDIYYRRIPRVVEREQ